MGLDHRVSTPVLLYLFHRIERNFDGRPTFIIIDEGWLIMMHEVFMSYWVEFLRTARKNNAVVVFATQSLADIVSSKCFSIINESCLSRIFLPNPSAKSPDSVELYKAFGLNEQQINIIAAATGKKHYYYTARDVGERLIDLGLSPLELAFYGVGAQADRKAIKALIEQDPSPWVPLWLKQKGLLSEAEEWMKL
jgi:type IV secretion system protein VirB4